MIVNLMLCSIIMKLWLMINISLDSFYIHFRICLNGSWGKEEHTVELNIGADKHSLLGAKSNSTSSRSDIVENQVTQLEFLNSSNTKVQKDDVFTSDFKDDNFHNLQRCQACPLFISWITRWFRDERLLMMSALVLLNLSEVVAWCWLKEWLWNKLKVINQNICPIFLTIQPTQEENNGCWKWTSLWNIMSANKTTWLLLTATNLPKRLYPTIVEPTWRFEKSIFC